MTTGPTQLELINLQIRAEEDAGMFKPRDHTKQFLSGYWDHPLDGVQPIPMGQGRAYKKAVLEMLRDKFERVDAEAITR